ncbi:MAG: hypothetical protein ACI4RN_06920 [Oscillospiraceae bacterium]
MDSEVYSVDTKALKNTAECIDDIVDSLSVEIERINSYFDMVDAVWSGSSHELFANRVLQCRESLDEILCELRDYCRDLHEVCKINENGEELISDLVLKMNF